MSINRVIINSSPLIVLLKSKQAKLLPQLFTEILVPLGVFEEVTTKDDVASTQLTSISWIQTVEVNAIAPVVAAWDLGKGESQVLSLALKNSDFAAIVDDRAARRCGQALGITTIGTGGFAINSNLKVRSLLLTSSSVSSAPLRFDSHAYILSLALELVRGYLDKKPDVSLETLLTRLENKRVEQEPVVNANSLMPSEYGVAEAFELSWEKLDENAQSFGCLLSLCALADIPLSIETIEDDKKQELNEKAIADLLELHLLQQKSQGIYRLNPEIRQLIQMKLDKSSEADEAKTKFAAMMLEVAKLIPQQPNPEDILNLTPHIPHITEVATHLSQYVGDENLITLFTKLAWFYQGQGLYQQAEPWLQQCVELTQNCLGLEHIVATSLSNLAGLYESTGRYNEAEPLLEQALELRKRLLGEEHIDVATSLSYLALIYESKGRYTKAELLYQQALELWKRLLGEEHPHVATSLNNLAALYCYTRRYSEAEPLLEQALKLRKRLLGQEHIDVATSLNNLAQLYESTGRHTKAEPLYQKALELSKRLLGDNHPDVAISMNNLAALYRYARRYRKAKPLFEKALKICERTLGVSHPTTMTIRENYTSCLREAAYH